MQVTILEAALDDLDRLPAPFKHGCWKSWSD